MLKVNIKSAGYGKKTILNDIAFSCPAKSFTAVIGRNGSGKSTLISAIASLVVYDGKIDIDGKDIRLFDRRTLSQKMSAMLQNLKRPHITVRELVALGRSPYISLGGRPSNEDVYIVEEAIRTARLEELCDSYVDRISGGELRRAYFAMILSQNTDVVLLDEATAFMDSEHESCFFDLTKHLSSTKTVISVMHNLDFALRYADNILLLDRGRVVFFGNREDILKTELIEKNFSVKRYTVGEKIFFSAD